MTLSAHTPAALPIRARLGGVAAAIGRAMTRYVETRSRRAEFEALNSLSDDRLADIGLRRDEIARHVYRDTLYV